MVSCWARGYVVQLPALPTHPGGPSESILLGEPGHQGAGSVGVSWTEPCVTSQAHVNSAQPSPSGPSGRNVRAGLPEAPRPPLGFLPPGAGADWQRHRAGAWRRGSKVSPRLCACAPCAHARGDVLSGVAAPRARGPAQQSLPQALPTHAPRIGHPGFKHCQSSRRKLTSCSDCARSLLRLLFWKLFCPLPDFPVGSGEPFHFNPCLVE